MATPTLVAPPTPYLVVADPEQPDEPLGFVHRPDDAPAWRYAFAPTAEGAEALRRLLDLVGQLGSASGAGHSDLPRARYDADGVPLTDDDGALVLDGVAEADGDRVAWLRSLAAFADALFAVEVVTG
ncbi:hypothetical protein GCM10023340_43810 [Nocardioides marinquilinus]|uniref:DUF317 domain-containing protein n=1 Tax=Nocardioides marinquilinus TaxID=1210400 RepID=A0ABP9Q633_9ACTN